MKNIEGHIDEITFDYASKKLLQSNHLLSHVLFIDVLQRAKQVKFIYD